MQARVGTLPVGTRIRTLLTGREGVVRAQWAAGVLPAETAVEFATGNKALHPEVRVAVVEFVQ